MTLYEQANKLYNEKPEAFNLVCNFRKDLDNPLEFELRLHKRKMLNKALKVLFTENERKAMQYYLLNCY